MRGAEIIRLMMSSHRLGRASLAVALLFFLSGAGVAAWFARIPEKQRILEVNDAVFGLAQVGLGLGAILSAPAAARLNSQIGNRRSTILGALTFGLVLILPAIARDATSLFLALLLVGFAHGLLEICLTVQGVAIEEMLGRPILARFQGMYAAGNLAGATVAGLLIDVGLSAPAHLSSASLLLLGSIAVTRSWLLSSSPSEGPPPSGAQPRRRALLVLTGIAFTVFIVQGAIVGWGGIYLMRRLQMTAGAAAGGLAVFLTLIAVGRLIGDQIIVRLGAVPVVRIGAVATASGVLMLVLADTSLVALTGLALAGIGVSCMGPILFGASGKTADISASGIAVVGMAGYAGLLVGPGMVGVAARHTSLTIALATLAIAMGVVGALAGVVDLYFGGNSIPAEGSGKSSC